MLNIETGQDNEILRKKSVKVGSVDKKLQKFIKEMMETMKKEKGVGLAAPQVGNNIRLIVVTIDNKKVMAMVNPEITSYSDKTCLGEEGCLSLPGTWANVLRYEDITVQFLDEKGKQKSLKLSDFNARVVQHEIDHLDGILFTDYLAMEEEFFNTPLTNPPSKRRTSNTPHNTPSQDGPVST